jgi:hypothetical protein
MNRCDPCRRELLISSRLDRVVGSGAGFEDVQIAAVNTVRSRWARKKGAETVDFRSD